MASVTPKNIDNNNNFYLNVFKHALLMFLSIVFTSTTGVAETKLTWGGVGGITDLALMVMMQYQLLQALMYSMWLYVSLGCFCNQE
jgi:hypothetical protein